MEILPILIFIGGIVYTAIASQKDKGKNEKRDIDTDKLGNPSKTSRKKPAESSQNSEKGFFEQIKGEIERSFGAPDDQSGQNTQTSKKTRQSSESSDQQRPQYQRTDRTTSSRPVADRSFGRTLEEKARKTETGKKAMDYYEDKVPTDRSEQRERAQKAKESVYSKGLNRSESEKPAKGIDRESAERSRYSMDENDLVKTSGKRPRVRKEKYASALDQDDFSFDRKAVLNGIIFSEILGKPKSKR